MTHKTAMLRDDTKNLALLKHLNLYVSFYSEALKISDDDLTPFKIGTDGFDYNINAQDATNHYNNALHAIKRNMRDQPNNANALSPSQPILLTAFTTLLYVNILDFINSLIYHVKKHKNYAEAIGKALNIIATLCSSVDIANLQPV